MISDFSKLTATVLLAVMFVVIGDTIGKVLTTGGTDPFIVAWSRFIIASLLLLPFAGLKMSELKYFLNWKVLMRGGFITCAIFCMITALKTESIANVFGAFFIGPIISYVLAVLFLGETPKRSQTFLLILGFIGVLIVVKPGFGATVGIGIGLLAGVSYGAYLASTRMVSGQYRPKFLLISQLLIGSAILTPIGLVQGIEMPELNVDLSLLLLGSAIFSAAGNFLLVVANRMAEASLIAPLVYSQLIFGTFFGFVVFNNLPDLLSLLGLILIAISGFGSLAISKFGAQRAVSLSRG